MTIITPGQLILKYVNSTAIILCFVEYCELGVEIFSFYYYTQLFGLRGDEHMMLLMAMLPHLSKGDPIFFIYEISF